MERQLPDYTQKTSSDGETSSFFLGIIDSLQRTELLIANGKDPNLIRILLHDARLWDQLREISEEQLHALLSLQTIYSRKQWFVMHEGFNSDSDEWKNFTGTLLQLREHNNEHFDQVTEKSQDLIKLVSII
jgi:hypothetical protein